MLSLNRVNEDPVEKKVPMLPVSNAIVHNAMEVFKAVAERDPAISTGGGRAPQLVETRPGYTQVHGRKRSGRIEQ